MSSIHGMISVTGSPAVDTLDDWVSPEIGVQYPSDSVAIAAESHACQSVSQPAVAENETVFCWLIGDVYGYDASIGGQSEEYETCPADVAPAQYCVSRYERDGLDFVRGLNGNFTLLLYDRERQEIALCTDRFGTVPLYWTQLDDDTVVFSTDIQELPSHPAVDTTFHPAYLHEYLAFRRTFGVKTPFEGVEKLEPGTITMVSLTDGTMTTDQYWRPRYQPCNESFTWFVDEFTRRFQTILDEWTRDGRDYGVLLSGGSDSRLVLAGLEDATAFHMNDWMNSEARTAKRVALEADTEFELLERGAQYRIDALERNRRAASFNGWFTQPYTSGFEDEITTQVDGLLSGLYGDSLFKGFAIPSPTVSLGPLGSMTLPIERSVETVDDYIELLLEAAHDDGLDMSTDLRSVLESNIYRDGDRIVHHGVTYDSLDELVYYGDCYPLSNDDDLRFHTGLRQTLPYRSPFLDNRLIDLSLSMPVEYRLRKNLVEQAVDRLAPSLAAIPHPNTGTALSRPFAVEYAGKHLMALWRKYATNRTLPEPYLTDGPWLDDAELLRSHAFVSDVLEEKAELADALPSPDADAIREMYHAHRHGENYVGELYTLLTVLTMPVTEHVLAHGPAGQHEKRATRLSARYPQKQAISDD